MGLGPFATVGVVAVLQVVTELLVGRNYGLALLFITPMALLMGQLAAPRPAGELLMERGLETVIGACFGMAIVLVEQASRRQSHVRPWALEGSRRGVRSAPFAPDETL